METLGLFAIVLYLLPTIIAYMRRSTMRGVVAVLNILLGWTILGWVIPLALAFGPTEGDASRTAYSAFRRTTEGYSPGVPLLGPEERRVGGLLGEGGVLDQWRERRAAERRREREAAIRVQEGERERLGRLVQRH